MSAFRRASWPEIVGGVGPATPSFVALLESHRPEAERFWGFPIGIESVALPHERGWLLGAALTRPLLLGSST